MSELKLMQQSQANKFDDLYTPKGVTKPVIDYLKKEGYTTCTIWECCDYGNSFVANDCIQAGLKVFRSGIDIDQTKGHYINYLEEHIGSLEDIHPSTFIVTNPPYSLKDKFLDKAVDDIIKGYIQGAAFLLPTKALAGVKRKQIFDKAIDNSVSLDVLVFDKRIDFTGKGANWFDVAWFILSDDPIGKPSTIEFVEYTKES